MMSFLFLFLLSVTLVDIHMLNIGQLGRAYDAGGTRKGCLTLETSHNIENRKLNHLIFPSYLKPQPTIWIVIQGNWEKKKK